MNSVTQQRIRSYIQELIEQANTVASTVRHTDDRVYSWVDSEDQARFRSECRNLIRLLGDAGEVWKDEFASNQNDLTTVTDMRGTLKAIGNAIDKGMLDRIEELAVAEAIGGLMDQADHLLSQNYFLAAG